MYLADSLQLDLTYLAHIGHDLITVVGDVLFNKCHDLVVSQPVTFTTPDSFRSLPMWDVSTRYVHSRSLHKITDNWVFICDISFANLRLLFLNFWQK
jgi:hypothetical protein